MRKGYKEGRRRSQNGRKRGVFWIRRWGVKIEGGGGECAGRGGSSFTARLQMSQRAETLEERWR